MPDIPMPWETDIRSAIENRTEIEFTFVGQRFSMQPYILFETRSGERFLRGTNLGPGGWLEVRVDQVIDLMVRRDLTFEPDRGFDKRDPRYYHVRAAV